MSKLEQPANWPSMDDPTSPTEHTTIPNGEVMDLEEPEVVVEKNKDEDADNDKGIEVT